MDDDPEARARLNVIETFLGMRPQPPEKPVVMGGVVMHQPSGPDNLMTRLRALDDRVSHLTREVAKLEAGLWVVAQIVASQAGVAPEDLEQRLRKALAEIDPRPAPTKPDGSGGGAGGPYR